ncbi:general transcription factor II-I repeat domain-containing protein 2-like [Genypterus blacodes]|uniref:general transcription factor II-I repeat domain-containing protein 2-like n=1 Tax=Genypterus blacodes TaxID=154954 RepID=UPI003F773969
MAEVSDDLFTMLTFREQHCTNTLYITGIGIDDEGMLEIWIHQHRSFDECRSELCNGTCTVFAPLECLPFLKELLGLKSMHGTTTGQELFEEVSKCVNGMRLPLDKLGLTTDGAPAMCGWKSGLVGTGHDGRGRVIADLYAAMRVFQTKLCLWKTQMLQGNLGYFPCCKTMQQQISTSVLPGAQFGEKLNILSVEFTRRFNDFEALKSRFGLLSYPFAVEVEHAPTNLQMELIELQCSDTLKQKYDSVGVAQFPRYIPDTMPHLHTQAAQMLSMFGSTYLCEQLFSLMKMNKTSHRSRLTDEHLQSGLRISSVQSLTPNIDELASKKRCQVSGLAQCAPE